jgi:hypothetical protein
MSESFIQVAMGDAPEEGLCEEGRYDLRIVNKKIKDTKKGDRKLLECVIVVEGEADVAPIMEYMVFPNKNDWDEEEGRLAKTFIRKLKRFCEPFGVSWQADGFDADQLDGATADNVLVAIEVGDDGIERNAIKFPRIDAGL